MFDGLINKLSAIWAVFFSTLRASWQITVGSLWDRLPPQFSEALELLNDIFTDVDGPWRMLNVVFPIAAVVGIIAWTWTAVAAIRVARWALSIIPRVFTGAD
jgi:hypothetical protein